jgi:trimeric autotransporter adhesin
VETVSFAIVRVVGITALDKPYDRTSNAGFVISTPTLQGVLSGDVVTLNTANARATFASAEGGNNIPVYMTRLSLSGAQAGNYALIEPTLSAIITPETATVTVTGITAYNKPYDGTTAAVLNFSGAQVQNTGSASFTMDNATAVGTFANPNVGHNIPVTITGFSVTANPADFNIVVVPEITSADITPYNGQVLGAVVSDGGSHSLSIALGTNQTLAITTNGTSYTLNSNQVFSPANGIDPADQSTAFAGLGTTTLTLTNAALNGKSGGFNDGVLVRGTITSNGGQQR